MKRFFSELLLRTFVSVITGVVFFGLSIGFIIYIVFQFEKVSPTVESGSVLVLDLNRSINDSPGAMDLEQLLEQSLSEETQSHASLRSILEAIDIAAEDSRIVSILIKGNLYTHNYGSGLAALGDVRRALERFREAGKPIYAYLENPSLPDYYLSSVASTVWMHPFGTLDWTGLGYQGTYWGAALKKYGVGVQAPRSGKYKSAVEPFLESQMSEASRYQLESLLQELWGGVLAEVANSRETTPAFLQDLSDTEGLLSAEQALSKGLVDQTLYFDEMVDALKEIGTPDSDNFSFLEVSIDDYIEEIQPLEDPFEENLDPAIAIVYAEGEIVDGEGDAEQVGGDRFAREIREIRQDNTIKAVVLRINSPGGSAYASEVIQRELKRLAAEKPLVISMGSVAASGGYWLATAGSPIIAEPNTVTGSIGVFGLLANVQELAQRHSVFFDQVKTGTYANIYSIARPATPAEMELVQGQVDEIYQSFLQRVSEARELPLEAVDAIAQGRVWSGQAALKNKLVDRLGGLHAAVDIAVEKAQLEAIPRIIDFPRKKDPAEILLESLENLETKLPDLDPGSGLGHRIFKHWKQQYQFWNQFNDPNNLYLRFPWDWE